MYYNYNVQVSKNFTISNKLSFLSRILIGKCEEIFSYIKRTICVFLAVAILFNVFVTKNQEFKNKFMSVVSCAVNTIEFSVLSEYTNMVLNAVNSIMKNLMPTVIANAKAKQENNKSKENKPVPVNSSSDEVIITKRITEISNAINIVNTKVTNSIYAVINQNNMLYRHVLMSSESKLLNVGILFFILFGIFIVRKRDEISNNVIKRIVKNRFAY